MSTDHNLAEALRKAVAELQGAGLKAPCYCVASKHWSDCSFSVRAKVLEECREALAAHERRAGEAVAWVDERAIAWLDGRSRTATITTKLQAGKSLERPMPLFTRPQQPLTDEQALANERDRICAAIKAEDDYCVTEGDYMLDSDDCIKIVRGEWVRPDYGITKDTK